jgi:citrate lyase gamma subunit
MIEGFLIGLKKRAEKSMIEGALANAMTSKTVQIRKQTEKKIEVECSAIKEKMNEVSVNLGEAVKGQFGEKVRESIKSQTEKINELHEKG